MHRLVEYSTWGYDIDDAVANLSDISEEHYGDDSETEDDDRTPAHFVIDESVRMEDMVARLVSRIYLHPALPKRV